MGCKVNLQTKGSLITKSLPDNKNNGTLCVRGRFGYEELIKDTRLRMPMIRKRRRAGGSKLGRSEYIYCQKNSRAFVSAMALTQWASVCGRMTNEDIYMDP